MSTNDDSFVALGPALAGFNASAEQGGKPAFNLGVVGIAGPEGGPPHRAEIRQEELGMGRLRMGSAERQALGAVVGARLRVGGVA